TVGSQLLWCFGLMSYTAGRSSAKRAALDAGAAATATRLSDAARAARAKARLRNLGLGARRVDISAVAKGIAGGVREQGGSGSPSAQALARGRRSRFSAARPLGAGEPVLTSPDRRLGAVGDADPLEDAGQVRLHGFLGNLETACDQLVREPLGDEAEDLR